MTMALEEKRQIWTFLSQFVHTVPIFKGSKTSWISEKGSDTLVSVCSSSCTFHGSRFLWWSPHTRKRAEVKQKVLKMPKPGLYLYTRHEFVSHSQTFPLLSILLYKSLCMINISINALQYNIMCPKLLWKSRNITGRGDKTETLPSLVWEEESKVVIVITNQWLYWIIT